MRGRKGYYGRSHEHRLNAYGIKTSQFGSNATPKPEMLKWIYDRMKNVHGENPDVDYMIRFKEIVDEENITFDIEDSKEDNMYYVTPSDDVDAIYGFRLKSQVDKFTKLYMIDIDEAMKYYMDYGH